MKKIKNMDVEWSYTGANGPEHWHTLCDWFAEGAKFSYQSPIALFSEEVADGEPIEPIEFHYHTEEFTEKEFKNTFHFVPVNTESYVVFHGEEYHLTDIHFHMPSEHVLEGRQYPLEFHLVHMNKTGENLVVGVLFTITTDYDRTFREMNGFVWEAGTHEQFFDPSLFLPTQTSHFHYTGSLTTPPTKGPINWFVFDQVQCMDNRFVQRIREGIVEFNNRPLQPLKGRKIYHLDSAKI